MARFSDHQSYPAAIVGIVLSHDVAAFFQTVNERGDSGWCDQQHAREFAWRVNAMTKMVETGELRKTEVCRFTHFRCAATRGIPPAYAGANAEKPFGDLALHGVTFS